MQRYAVGLMSVLLRLEGCPMPIAPRRKPIFDLQITKKKEDANCIWVEGGKMFMHIYDDKQVQDLANRRDVVQFDQKTQANIQEVIDHLPKKCKYFIPRLENGEFSTKKYDAKEFLNLLTRFNLKTRVNRHANATEYHNVWRSKMSEREKALYFRGMRHSSKVSEDVYWDRPASISMKLWNRYQESLKQDSEKSEVPEDEVAVAQAEPEPEQVDAKEPQVEQAEQAEPQPEQVEAKEQAKEHQAEQAEMEVEAKDPEADKVEMNDLELDSIARDLEQSNAALLLQIEPNPKKRKMYVEAQAQIRNTRRKLADIECRIAEKKFLSELLLQR
jgi:hypothetical protein